MNASKYILFEALMNKINAKYGVEPIHVQILDYLTEQNHKNIDVSVSDVLARREIASPATIHLRLQQLIKLGMLTINQPSDQRKKLLMITEKTNSRMQEVCKLLNEELN